MSDACREADLLEIANFTQIVKLCRQSKVGKILPDAFYIHLSAIAELDDLLIAYEAKARELLGKKDNDREGCVGFPRLSNRGVDYNILKFGLAKPQISYLFYPKFDEDPHPCLKSSLIINLQTKGIDYRDYTDSKNPPILHRKETFISKQHHLYDKFSHLTKCEQEVGLLKPAKQIGFLKQWQQFLNLNHIQFEDHYLACSLNKASNQNKLLDIDRHKAAIVRNDLSRPVKLALEANLLSDKVSFFDYGCGRGGDVSRLASQGIESAGWDPHYFPEYSLKSADVVNVGYVINVIENLTERRQALINAWNLTNKVLIVSAQVLVSDASKNWIAYGDGVVTSRNTFQKYFEQEELKIYIDQVLGVDSIPSGLGIYFVFRDPIEAEKFRSSRFRSRARTPRVQLRVNYFEEYQHLLAPLMEFMTERGRLPVKGELDGEQEIRAKFGSLRKAFNLILRATSEDEWTAIAEKRSQELLIYLALTNFHKRPKYRQLSSDVQEDIKALFGSYKQACTEADAMLLSLGNLENIKQAADESSIGKKLTNSLLIHISALDQLDPLLRLYEGCASRTIGRLEDVNIIKFHTNKPQISYLHYPNFDDDPHPFLKTSMQIRLSDLRVFYRDYELQDDTPILHQKDLLVTENYPAYQKFTKLTAQENNWDLLSNWQQIRSYGGWQTCLEEHCAELKGHRVYFRKGTDPYKLKILKSGIQKRSRKSKR
ncbi:MAG: DNA phosphorothioation-associated putative methyltransferase [Xenococcus sp. MO_188.B8]|nr:DNA phosphorothioation-associated putative methyltransferase [Xenococcus sp. MO_188.B8]